MGHALGRRRFLMTAAAATGAISLPATRPARAGDINPACTECCGTGLTPLVKPKPYVFIEGSGAFKPAEAAVAQPCPLCEPKGDKTPLADEAAEQHETVLGKHKEWEEKTGWRLGLVQTRHVSIHTQHQVTDARRIGLAVEALTIHLQRVTGSLELTLTRPAAYQQMLLLREASWTKFREVMESIYPLEQLGQSWPLARVMTGYDFPDVAHAYTPPERMRDLPPEYQAVKFAATRQMQLATNWKAPEWLWEGLASYGQQAALGDVRISTVYSPERGPKAVFAIRDAKQQAALRRLRPWPEMIGRELRDFEGQDYYQSLGMVAFLLESQPAKFLEFLRLLKADEKCQPALEKAYGKEMEAIAEASAKWLVR